MRNRWKMPNYWCLFLVSECAVSVLTDRLAESHAKSVGSRFVCFFGISLLIFVVTLSGPLLSIIAMGEFKGKIFSWWEEKQSVV
jgi:hypothetical protein